MNRLYVVPASHPCAVVESVLRLKGVPYRRVDLIPVQHVLHQKLRFGRRTVPGMVFDDGTKVVGSKAILRELDRRVPEPRIVSEDPRAVEAESWGEEVLQPLARRLVWTALKRSQASMPSYSEGSRLPIPVKLAALGSPVVARAEIALNRASEAAVREDLAHLDEHLDRADRYVAEGVIGGEPPNAADLQIAASLRLLLTLGDLAPRIDARPCGELARRRFPDYPGHTPPGALPAAWLSGGAAAAASSR